MKGTQKSQQDIFRMRTSQGMYQTFEKISNKVKKKQEDNLEEGNQAG